MSSTRRRGRGWIMVALLAVAAAAAMWQRRAATGHSTAPSPGEPDFAPFTATTPAAAQPAPPAATAPAPAAKKPAAKKPASKQPAAAKQPTAAKPVAKQPAAPAPKKAAAKKSAWVAPVDGECPKGYPVKVVQSGIFHLPGGRFYARATPERCYADAASATADGYRQSKA